MSTNTSDRELLELAAKAAGFELIWRGSDASVEADVIDGFVPYRREGSSLFIWNPRDRDGDALRLAVKLKLRDVAGEVWAIEGSSISEYELDHYAATRRAIVRAAAAIGRNLI